MPKKRFYLLLAMYAAIVAAMLFVSLVVQGRYGVPPTGPYKRRFLDKFFLEAPAAPPAALPLRPMEASDSPDSPESV